MSITAVSFLYNEDTILERSLAALRPFLDEIVVVDLESTDGTLAICKKYADKVLERPWLICGDEYKSLLRDEANGDWLLWFYGDEVFPEKTVKAMKTVAATDEFTAYAFMRQEYMDGIRLMPHGTAESPNYQNRLHKKIHGVHYNGLVHWEIPKELHTCPMPPDFYMEHIKTSAGQEFDSIRLYIYYHYLTWLYGDTQIDPYREYVASYRTIIHDSEAKNLSGEREISLAEEFWWDWRKYSHEQRVTLDEFKERTGIEYAEFLERRKDSGPGTFAIQPGIVDRAIREMNHEA